MAKRRSDSSANDMSSASSGRAPKASKTRRSLATEPAEPAIVAAGIMESPMGVAAQPTEDEIRARAYFRYLERGSSDGGAFEDWLFAERELKKN